MVGVGMAAPAAMSHNAATVAISIILASLLLIPAVFIAVVKLVLGIGHMLEHGAQKATLPTLWVGIPILTTLSIASLRVEHGLNHTLLPVETSGSSFMFLTLVFATMMFLVMLGASVMQRMGYFHSVWNGLERTPVVYALICPGVALSVSLHFLLNKGLVAAGVVAKFGFAYWSFSALAIVLQVFTAVMLFRLVRQLIAQQRERLAVVCA